MPRTETCNSLTLVEKSSFITYDEDDNPSIEKYHGN